MFLKPSAALPALFVTALLGAMAVPAEAQNGALRLATINTQQIIDQAPGAREAQQELEELANSSRQELQGMEQELQQMSEEYERQRSTMAPERREEREQEIMERQQAYFQRQQQLEQELSQRQQQLVNPILERVQNVIDDIRVEGNYTMIFDQAPGTGVLAADPSLDITDQVLARLRSSANNR